MPLLWAWGRSWRTGWWPQAALAETRPRCRAGQCPAGPAQSVSTTHPPPRTRARLGRLPAGVAGPRLRPPDQDGRACVPGWPSSSGAAGEPPRPGWELPAAVLAHEIRMSRWGTECSDCRHGVRGLQSVKRPGRGPSHEPVVSAAPPRPAPPHLGRGPRTGQAGWRDPRPPTRAAAAQASQERSPGPQGVASSRREHAEPDPRPRPVPGLPSLRGPRGPLQEICPRHKLRRMGREGTQAEGPGAAGTEGRG